MSKLAHSNQETMDQIEIKEAIKNGNEDMIRTMAPQEFQDWRRRLGLSQERAAKALGKCRSTICAYEAGINGRKNTIEIPLAVELACKWLEEQDMKKFMTEAMEIVHALTKRN